MPEYPLFPHDTVCQIVPSATIVMDHQTSTFSVFPTLLSRTFVNRQHAFLGVQRVQST